MEKTALNRNNTMQRQHLFKYKWWWLLLALCLYLLLSWLYFGIDILGHPGRLKGISIDPIIYLWYIHWWPYAISHHLNPFISQWVWAPSGYNMAKSTSVLGVYLLSLPFQLVTSTLTAYNILVIFAPGVAAWTMYLLCLYLTRKYLPAWIGGYLFGFSAYMIGQTLSHANLSVGVFLLPIAITLIILYIRRQIRPILFIIAMTAIMTLLFLISAEMAATFSACMAIAFIAACFAYPVVRQRAGKLIIVMLIAALLCSLLLSPFLYHFLSDTINGIYINRPHYYPNDLLSFFIPEPFMQFITPFTVKLSHNFVGNSPEHGAYLGLPLLLILLLFAWRHWRRAGTKYLLLLTLIYAILSLSATWYFNGKKLFVLFLSHWFFYWVPGLKYSLACRYSLYTSFVVAIIVTLWLANHSVSRLASAVKYLLVLLALVLLLPCIKPIVHLHPDSIYPAYTQLDTSKTFFSKPELYKKWLKPGENVLIIPLHSATWAQIQSNFYFKIAAAYLGPLPLAALRSPIFTLIYQKRPDNRVTAKEFSQFLTQRQISAVIITDNRYQALQPLLQALAYKPIHVGGIWLYPLTKENRGN